MESAVKIRCLSIGLVISIGLIVSLLAYIYFNDQSSEDIGSALDNSFANQNQKPVDDWLQPFPSDPNDHFQQMQSRMQSMMENFSQGFPSMQSPFDDSFSNMGSLFQQGNPNISMQELNNEYRIEVSIPEGQEVEVNTDLTHNQLTISGTVKNKTEEGQSFSQSTRQFSQSMTLPGSIDEGGMKVEQEENQIIVIVPKVTS